MERNFLFVAYCNSYPSAFVTFFQDIETAFFFLFLAVSFVAFLMLGGTLLLLFDAVVGKGLVVDAYLLFCTGWELGVGGCGKGEVDGVVYEISCFSEIPHTVQVLSLMPFNVGVAGLIIFHELKSWLPLSGIFPFPRHVKQGSDVEPLPSQRLQIIFSFFEPFPLHAEQVSSFPYVNLPVALQ